jgi:uncharacterized protein (TIGR03435 family)
MQALIRRILANRFGMKMHREQREMLVFALAVAKGGPKLTPNTSNPNGMPTSRAVREMGAIQRSLRTRASMSDLAQILQFALAGR